MTLTTDTTWSVGLPSLSAATQVPASFFIRSRPACGLAGPFVFAFGLAFAVAHAGEGEQDQPADPERCVIRSPGEFQNEDSRASLGRGANMHTIH